MQSLVIVGAGAVGRHLAWNFKDYSLDFNLLGFLDDDQEKCGTQIAGKPVLGPISSILDFPEAAVVVAIAEPQIRKRAVSVAAKATQDFPSAIHRASWLSQGSTFGQGLIVYPGATINFESYLGDFVIVNMNCAVGHNSSIGDYSTLAPGVNLAGHTHVGEGVSVGIGACTRNNVRLGDGCVVGGQAMVTRDVPAGASVVGVPGNQNPLALARQ